jgi:hypothetical protein
VASYVRAARKATARASPRRAARPRRHDSRSSAIERSVANVAPLFIEVWTTARRAMSSGAHTSAKTPARKAVSVAAGSSRRMTSHVSHAPRSR